MRPCNAQSTPTDHVTPFKASRLCCLWLLLLLLPSGCAWHQTVTIITEPPNAEISVNGVPHGRSPATASLLTDAAATTMADRRHTIVARLDGYQDEMLVLQSPSVFLSDVKPFPDVLTIRLRKVTSPQTVPSEPEQKLPSPGLSGKQTQGRRVALIIGNAAYKDSPLRNPANDARDFASTLKRLGFEVILRTDADLQTMDRAIDEFYANLRKGGTGLFYYAGHGLQVGGINYLVPVDARLESESDVRYRAIDAGRVLGKMEDAGNKLNIVILDACRNNPFARSFRSASQGLAKMDAPTGSLIAYATAPGSVAADGTGKNGVYTKHLLHNMTTPGLSVEEMFKRVRLGVVNETRNLQVPWESSSLTGNFSFQQ